MRNAARSLLCARPTYPVTMIKVHDEGWVAKAAVSAGGVLQLRKPCALFLIQPLVPIKIDLLIFFIPTLLSSALTRSVASLASSFVPRSAKEVGRIQIQLGNRGTYAPMGCATITIEAESSSNLTPCYRRGYSQPKIIV
jgi:hypothetical protein